MNKLLLCLLTSLLLSTEAFTAQIPYSPEMEDRFNTIEANSWVTNAKLGQSSVSETKLGYYAVDGLHPLRIARASYNVAVSGGTSSVAHGLGVSLPAKAIIKRSYAEVITKFTEQYAGGTVALSCENANNIYSAANIAGINAGQFIEGVSSGASSVFKKITNACEITATVATQTQTAGKLVVFVEYLVSE